MLYTLIMGLLSEETVVLRRWGGGGGGGTNVWFINRGSEVEWVSPQLCL